jgi:hypothetical protein
MHSVRRLGARRGAEAENLPVLSLSQYLWYSTPYFFWVSTSALCAFATASAVAPWISWMSMYIGIWGSDWLGATVFDRSAGVRVQVQDARMRRETAISGGCRNVW